MTQIQSHCMGISPQSYAHTKKLGGLENTELFCFTLLRQLSMNFLQWLIKYINIHGGSRIIAENNEIHLMKNQNLSIHPLQLNIFLSTHYNSKLHSNSTHYNSKLHNDFKHHFWEIPRHEPHFEAHEVVFKST